jgi:putative (di)nucleoside polyphosphate hydrolase
VLITQNLEITFHSTRVDDVVDADGFRPNVGIILTNDHGQLFWARRIGQKAWQFPQGGINPGESLEDAMYRELWEEVGLDPSQVQVLGATKKWLRYYLPPRFIRRNSWPRCIGQKQIWFMLRMNASEQHVRFDTTDDPEFDAWRWVEYWHPLREVVFFKRKVYKRALSELRPLLFEPIDSDEGSREETESSSIIISAPVK